MANERISMRKIKEFLRLRFELGLSKAKTAEILNIGRTTVREYDRRFRASGLTLPLPADMNDEKIWNLLFPKNVPKNRLRQPLPLDYLVMEMKRPNVTLALLWEEYKKASPEGYEYSQFANLYREHQKTLSYSMRQDHKAGEKGFVDFGDGLWIRDPESGRMIPTSLFVFVWGASSYLFAIATKDQSLTSWIGAHIKSFDYFECVPYALVPDNTKAAVSKTCRYEPDLNPTYADLAAHYNLCIIPARPRRPKDKGKVENGVLLAKRWILARLRNHIFDTLEDLNEAIAVLVREFNDRPLKKLGISRKALFLKLDKPNARMLPEHPFELAQWKKVRVGVNYHVEYDKHFYSAPYTLIHRELEIRATSSVIQIYKDGQRIVMHPRSFKEFTYTTNKEHMPPSHQKYLEWTPERILSWAQKHGSSVKELVEKIMASRAFPEQAYRSCLGIIRLGNHYSSERLNGACKRALVYHMYSYRGIKNILKKGLDKKEGSPGAKVVICHENLRGPEYYK